MPRFAYALPLADGRATQWRHAAEGLLGDGAKDHRAFLLERGIFRERMWIQTGTGTPDLTLALWDCDDVDTATRLRAPDATAHDRWLLETVLGSFHGQDVATFTFPEPEMLSGTTTMATAAAGTQTMFALPVADEGLQAVRQLIDRIEQGDLAAAHSAFLTDASIREEWIWLQEARPDTPALLLIHWIGDDLPGAWNRLTHVGQDPYARVLRDALFTLVVGLPPVVVAGWDIEQVLAMHVRRSDTVEPPATRLGSRIGGAMARRRWDVLRQACAAEVTVHDPEPRRLCSADAMSLLAEATAALPGSVDDVLISERQILCVMRPTASGPTTAVLFGVHDGAICSLRLVADWTSA